MRRSQRTLVVVVSALMVVCLVLWGGMVASDRRAVADRRRCASQLIALGQAIFLYCNENRGSLPSSWREVCVTQDIPSGIFVCPASDDTPAPGGDLEARGRGLVGGGHCSYRYAGGGKIDDLTPDVVLAVEDPGHHGGDFEVNVLFGDGRVRHITGAAAKGIVDALSRGVRPVRYSGGEGEVMRKGGG